MSRFGQIVPGPKNIASPSLVPGLNSSNVSTVISVYTPHSVIIIPINQTQRFRLLFGLVIRALNPCQRGYFSGLWHKPITKNWQLVILIQAVSQLYEGQKPLRRAAKAAHYVEKCIKLVAHDLLNVIKPKAHHLIRYCRDCVGIIYKILVGWIKL